MFVVALSLLGICGYAYHLVKENATASNKQIKSYYDSHRTLRIVNEKLQTLEAELRQNINKTDDPQAMAALQQACSSFNKAEHLLATDKTLCKNPIFSGLASSISIMSQRLNRDLVSWQRGNIPPPLELIKALRKMLHLTERRFYDGIVDQAYQALNASQILKKVILYLALSTFFILMAAYALFEMSIRRPLLLVAKALCAEGRNSKKKYPLPEKDKAVEIRFLIDAFNGMRQQVRSRHQRLHSVLESASDGIITFDFTGKIDSINGAGEKLLHVERKAIIGKNILDVVPLERFVSKETLTESSLPSVLKQSEGKELEASIPVGKSSIRHLSLKLSEFSIAEKRYFNALISDISERKSLIDRLAFLAQRDALTGLFNRRLFFEKLNHAYIDSKQQASDSRPVLISIDLDRFKHINDSMGHEAGDLLLKDIARILAERCRKSDILARLGGDEFVVLVYDTQIHEAAKIAEEYRKSLTNYPFRYKNKLVEISCSIGVAMLSDDIFHPEELVARADLAMRAAKETGRNCVQFFEHVDNATRKRMEATGYSSVIEEALRNDHFYPRFHPIADTGNGNTIGYETLACLKTESGNDTVPMVYLIEAAERYGLAVEIDKKMLSSVADLLNTNSSWLEGKLLSFNLSAQSIGDEEILGNIKKLLKHPVFTEGKLVLEITETTAITNLRETQKCLEKLRALGCLTALDNFGSGYSSFAYLRSLPVDFIKLDREYVQNLHKDPVEVSIIKAVHLVAQAMGARTIAEGVEKREEQETLVEIGIEFAQGKLFGGSFTQYIEEPSG